MANAINQSSLFSKPLNTFLKAISYFPFVFVVGVFIYDYYVFINIIIVNLSLKYKYISILLFILQTIFEIISLICYFLCVKTSSFVKDYKRPKSKKYFPLPQCEKCKNIKPYRAHHCSLCQTCVLKMDHHCPWIVNCVGFHNYKYFSLFLFWTFLSSITFITSGFHMFISKYKSLQFYLAYFITLPFTIILPFFIIFHLKLIFDAKTTIEFGKSFNFYRSDRSEFDLGSYKKNFKSVFGENAKFWLLPVKTDFFNGFDFHELTISQFIDNDIDDEDEDENNETKPLLDV